MVRPADDVEPEPAGDVTLAPLEQVLQDFSSAPDSKDRSQPRRVQRQARTAGRFSKCRSISRTRPDRIGTVSPGLPRSNGT